MMRTRLVAVSGMVLAVSSIVLGPEFWGYQTGVLMLQVGIIALGLGFFLRINSRSAILVLDFLDDIESVPRRATDYGPTTDIVR